MNPGQLKHNIEIQHYVPSANAYGEPSKTWSQFASVRSARKSLRGGEGYKNNQIISDATEQFTFRYLAGVTTKMRVLWDQRYFDILFVDQEINKTTRLECREIT